MAGAVHVDSTLRLVFDKPPVLGTGGTIRVFRQADDALVDVIKLSGETDMIGYPGQDLIRKVNTTPIQIAGNTVTIKLHSNKPGYNTAYYVAIADGVFTGTSLGGVPFRGIGKLGGWSFSTRAAAPGGTTVTVDDDGVADFRSVQGALSYAMKNFAKAEPVTIQVMNGEYEELLYLRGKDNVSIVGQSRDGVVIRYTNHNTLNPFTGGSQVPSATAPATGGRAVMLVEASDMLSLDTLSINNTTLRGATTGQAETLYFNNDGGRLIARNSAFYSEQDTLNLKGFNWFYRSLVSGNVDFIWGGSRAALFEESEIRTIGDSASPTGGGYVLQARVVNPLDKGFVFLNSALTRGPGRGPLKSEVPDGATWLARSPGGTSSYDNIAFIHTRMDRHVAPAGWAGLGVNSQPAPNPVLPTALSGWREYGSTDLAGVPLDLARRVGGYLLRSDEVEVGFSTRAKVFAAYGNGAGWNPQP